MSEVKTPRRFALLSAFANERAGNFALAMALRGKQSQLAGGAPLAIDFPSLPQLVLAGYSMTADLDGADVAELAMNAGLSRKEADAVLAAL